MALQWTSTLSVGVPELDEPRREFFRRVDRLLDAVLHQDRAEAVGLLGWLRRYVDDHVVREEQLMARLGYPDAEGHLAEHQAFVACLEVLEAEHQAQGPSALLVFRLERLTTGWIRDHVAGTDVALGRFVKARLAAEPACASPSRPANRAC